MRRELEDVLPVVLGNAAQNAKSPSIDLLLEVRQPCENLLLRLIANGAGVVENQSGLVRRLHLRVAARGERASNFLRVVHVHLAAERF